MKADGACFYKSSSMKNECVGKYRAANGNTSTSQSTTESPNTEENVSQPSNGSGEKGKKV